MSFKCPPCAGFCVFKTTLDEVLLVNDCGFPKGKLDLIENTDQKNKKPKKKLEESLVGAYRELKEETGLPADKIKQIGSDYIDEMSVKGNPATRYYVAVIMDDTFKFKPEDTLEIQKACFVPINEAMTLLSKKRQDVLKKALELVKR